MPGSEVNITALFWVSALVALLLVVAIAFFVLVYQRKMMQQQEEMVAREQRHQQELLAAALESQEAERRRVARDLHDDLGALLTTARMGLHQFRRKVELDQGPARRLEQTLEVIDASIESVRKTAHQLLPPTLERFGLLKALAQLTDQVNQQGEVRVQFQADELPELTAQAASGLYRMVQEMLNNALKHARADRIDLSLRREGDLLHLEFADNGRGFDPESNAGKGLGLKNLESRCQTLGGSLQLHSQTGQGTRYTSSFQLAPLCQLPS